MTDAEQEAAQADIYRKDWIMLIYGLSIWGWLFIAIVLFALAASASGR